MKIPQFILAAPSSGSGKTTISRGLMKLLHDRGLSVQPYKCGPDYIDTKFHTAVCGRPSVNLDSFMSSEQHIRSLYSHYSTGADACIVEGMMGLFDGYDRDRGSVARIAGLLHLPIILVVDARSAAYSIAPLLYGFMHFRPDTDIRGVIFNKVGSERHYNMLLQVCADLGLECFGYMPKDKDVETSSRYLGLDFSTESGTGRLVEQINRHIDWRRLLQQTSMDIIPTDSPAWTAAKRSFGHTIVASNAESFSFVYREHLDILQASSAQVTLFDPESDIPLPSDTDLLYLPGGYPEKHVDALTAAAHTRSSIRSYAQHDGKILAECGGMMYLCRSILHDSDDGTPAEAPMCGVLPYSISARKADRHLSLGYRSLRLGSLELRGHEFHYTQFSGDMPVSAADVFDARGQHTATPVICQDNVIASYTHLYWGETPIDHLFHLS